MSEEPTATLACRVKRTPASLGGMHYWLLPGKRVFIFHQSETHATVSTVPDDDRISDDYFRVSLSDLNLD